MSAETWALVLWLATVAAGVLLGWLLRGEAIVRAKDDGQPHLSVRWEE